LERLKKRSEFILASKSPHVWKRPAFVLQLRLRTGGEHPRVGFTVTKRQGNAVIRNRIKRRLREVVQQSLGAQLQSDCDYVFIGRRSAVEVPFALLEQEMSEAVKRLHQKASKSA